METKGTNNELKAELINYVVKATQEVIMSHTKTLQPKEGGSGCLFIYRDVPFFVSVAHVTDKEDLQATIVTGRIINDQTELYSLPAFNYIDSIELKKNDTGGVITEEIKNLDICYTEMVEEISLDQQAFTIGETEVKAGSKIIIITDLDQTPNHEEGYSFYGKVKGSFDGKTLAREGKFVLGMKYDCKVGPFERFILTDPIVNELYFKGTSGAPIISETGEPVAFVTHGVIGQKYIYGFSAVELKKYLDLHIQTQQNNSTIPEFYEKYSNFSGDEDDSNEKEDNSLDDKISLGSLFESSSDSNYSDIKFSSHFEFKTNQTKKEPEFLSYEVLYGTNRKAVIKSGSLDYSNLRDREIHFGLCEVSIPSKHKVGNIERPSWFSKLFFNESPAKHFTILNNDLITESDFGASLKTKLTKSDEKDILLFIHGFNVEFYEDMYRTAQLGHDLCFKGAVTSFSWPSFGSVPGYGADTDSARLSGKYLHQFIKLLLSKAPKKLHIIAHSMGNVVLTEALMLLKNENSIPDGVINEVILAAPDLDKDIFLDIILPKIKNTARFTLYASSNDNALKASKKIRMDYTRLGEGGKNLVITEGLQSIDASKVDTSLLGHGYFADTQSLLNDIHQVLKGIAPEQRLLDQKNKMIEGQLLNYWMFKNT